MLPAEDIERIREEYDQPGLKTNGDVATMPEGSAAWFRDPEGNIINITELR
ncbi:MAG: VOC family protein [Coriobacteriia bacterium]